MNSIRIKRHFYHEFDASIDAIFVIWCPIKNGRSGILKTIITLKDSFGDEILKSCVAVRQGNWIRLAQFVPDLNEAVPQEIQILKETFPKMPIIEYGAMGNVEDQFPILYDAIHEVKPHSQESVDENEKAQFLKNAHIFQVECDNLLRRQRELLKY